MKSKIRSLLFHLTIGLVAISITSGVRAADNPFAGMWPFGKSTKSTPAFKSPLQLPQKPASKSLLSGPSRMLDKAGQQTNSFFAKTKDGFKGMQNFGKSMNPFSKPKQNKKSLLDTMFPKQPVESGPATVGEFLNMKRPNF